MSKCHNMIVPAHAILTNKKPESRKETTLLCRAGPPTPRDDDAMTAYHIDAAVRGRFHDDDLHAGHHSGRRVGACGGRRIALNANESMITAKARKQVQGRRAPKRNPKRDKACTP